MKEIGVSGYLLKELTMSLENLKRKRCELMDCKQSFEGFADKIE